MVCVCLKDYYFSGGLSMNAAGGKLTGGTEEWLHECLLPERGRTKKRGEGETCPPVPRKNILLSLQVHHFLQELIRRCYDSRVCLKTPL